MPSPDDIEDALSLERFSRYVGWAGGDRRAAVELYSLNARISEALYIPIHGLEIALRNRIHTVMTAAEGERWFETDGRLAAPHQQDQLATAIAEIEEAGKEASAGRIVAALTFSFWTAMLSPAYENLWRTTLNRIAETEEGKRLPRKSFSRPLTQIRLLRNRTAHHEPILHWNLVKHHGNILQLTRWLSPGVHHWVASIDRFDVVIGEGYTLAAADDTD
jgi:hypothetical protein